MIDLASRPTIYLVNQLSRHGHLDLYARLYSACALKLGYRVVLVAEHDTGVREWLTAHHPAASIHFQFHARRSSSRNANDPESANFWGRVAHVWRTQGAAGLMRRGISSVASRSARVVRGLSWISRLIGGPIIRTHGMSFVPLVDDIVLAERLSGWLPSLVVFLYLDMMNEDRLGRRYLDKKLRKPWGGILFHPQYVPWNEGSRPERYFEARTARGAAFLNPHCLESYRRAFPDQAFGLLPDVTETTISPDRPALVAEFTRRADGRTIVGLIGSVTSDKGLPEFLKVVDRADHERFFFLIIGEVFWGSFGAEESTVRGFLLAPPEHCFLHIGYIDDERDLNAVIAATDILYAVYPNQRDSANTLTKAAFFEKPVLVNEAHLMGERVRDFNLGATVRCSDVDDIIGALARLRDEPRSAFGFARYREAHSTAALEESFGALVADWIQAA